MPHKHQSLAGAVLLEDGRQRLRPETGASLSFTISAPRTRSGRYPTASARATEAAMNLVLTADLIVKHISDLLRPMR
jgi:hypothetical protein